MTKFFHMTTFSFTTFIFLMTFFSCDKFVYHDKFFANDKYICVLMTTFFSHDKIFSHDNHFFHWNFFPILLFNTFRDTNMASYGKCVFKSYCDLNCLVFVDTPSEDTTPQSICLACNHLAAFHDPICNSVNTASYTSENRNPFPLVTATNGQPSTKTRSDSKPIDPSTASGSFSGGFGKAKTFAAWLKDKRSSEFRKAKKRKVDHKPGQEELVAINTALMEANGGELKKVCSKRLPLKVPKNATYQPY